MARHAFFEPSFETRLPGRRRSCRPQTRLSSQGASDRVVLRAIGRDRRPRSQRPERARVAALAKAALDLAGAFSNEGFKMRDGHWSGTITTERTRADRGQSLCRQSILVFGSARLSRPKKKSQSTFTTKPGKLVQTES